MTRTEPIPPTLMRLMEDYLAGDLDEAGFAALEQELSASETARAHFVRYCGVETDLHKLMRGRQAAAKAIEKVLGEPQPRAEVPATGRAPSRAFHLDRRVRWLVAACLLFAIGSAAFWVFRPRVPSAEPAEVAWVTNAQDCEWESVPAGRLIAGQVLRMRRGLVELRMSGGATIVLEGPAEITLAAADCVRMVRGGLAVRAAGPAKGFQVLLPQGKVIDLGTEFGIRIADSGVADLQVYEGKVEAYAEKASGKVALVQSQSARISSEQVVVGTPSTTQPVVIARQIERTPKRIARRAVLDFAAAHPGTLGDQSGIGTGLTHRLPGTGSALAEHDANLRLLPDKGQLQLETTRSDINRRFHLADGEYLGLRLSDMGFSGSEDFEVSVVVPNIPSLAAVGQFGLYAGSRCDRCIRGGLISQRTRNSYSQFLVNNEAGIDRDATYVGLVTPGNDVRLALRRQGGKYSLTVENLSNGASSTLSIRHLPSFDEERNLYVGLFGANIGDEKSAMLTINEMSVTVWARE